MCEGPGAGMIAWPECRKGSTLWQPHWDDLCPKDEFLFPFHFDSLSVYCFESHCGLASFKCIWKEICNVNSVVRCEVLISLWFFFTAHCLWISGEDMRILIVLIVFFSPVWPHYVNFSIVLGYENIKAITHLCEDWMCGEVVMETRGNIHIDLSKLNNPP